MVFFSSSLSLSLSPWYLLPDKLNMVHYNLNGHTVCYILINFLWTRWLKFSWWQIKSGCRASPFLFVYDCRHRNRCIVSLCMATLKWITCGSLNYRTTGHSDHLMSNISEIFLHLVTCKHKIHVIHWFRF